jgi:hypothetical protein
MKIEDLLLLQQTPARRQTGPSPGENFAECLNGAVAATQGRQPSKTAGLSPTAGVDPADEVLHTSAELADAALSRLEILQTSLGRADISLRKMGPLVQKLEEDSRRLHDVAQGLPEGSPLRQLLEETAALALVESFKFNRGDYV